MRCAYIHTLFLLGEKNAKKCADIDTLFLTVNVCPYNHNPDRRAGGGGDGCMGDWYRLFEQSAGIEGGG